MGNSVNLVAAIEFIVEDEERSKEIVNTYLESIGQDELDIIDDLSSYIPIKGSDIRITLCSAPDDWNEVSCSSGNFSLYIDTNDCWATPSKITQLHDKMKFHADKISDLFGVSYTKIIIGTYG